MEAARISETLVNFYQTTRCYNPEDSHLRRLNCLKGKKKKRKLRCNSAQRNCVRQTPSCENQRSPSYSKNTSPGSLLHWQASAIGHCSRPDKSSSHCPTWFNLTSYLLIVVSSVQDYQLKCHIDFSSLPFMLLVPLIFTETEDNRNWIHEMESLSFGNSASSCSKEMFHDAQITLNILIYFHVVRFTK
jgi:hypothetical protein